MAGTISSAGIGAGIDGNSIISQLTALQRSQPLQRLKDAASSLDTQISTVGTLKSLMSTLQDAARKVTDKGAWQLATATSSNTAVAVKVTGAALPSSSTIEVSKLARAQSLTSQVFSVPSGATDAVFNTGGGNINLQITSQADATKTAGISITPGMTLTQVAEAINKQSGTTGVTASVITDAKGQRLSMSAKNSGESNGFTLSGSDPAVRAALGVDASGVPSGSGSTAAVALTGQNAVATVNGVEVQSATNEFKKTLPGLSFTVSQVTQAGAPALVTVAADTDGMKKNLQAFIDAYNALNAKLADVTKYDAESKTRGVMQGDSSIVSITSELRATLSSNLGGINLSDLGIQMGKGGQLSFGTSATDKAKLEAALQDPDKMTQVLSAEGTDGQPNSKGLAMRVKEFTDKMLAFQTGTFDTKTDSLRKAKQDNAKQQDRVNDRADQYEARLRAQYASLDKRMGSMSGLSAYLANQVSQWNK